MTKTQNEWAGGPKAEHLLRSLLFSSPDNILVVDANDNILFINKTELPQGVDGIIGTSAYSYVPEESRDMLKQSFMKVRATHQLDTYEVFTTGTKRWYEVRVLPLDLSGDEGNLILIARDITAAREEESRKRILEAHLRILIDQIPVLVWSTDKDVRFTSMRGAAMKALRASEKDIVGKTLYDFIPDRTTPAVLAHEDCLRGKSGSYEVAWGDRQFKSYVSPLTDSSGAPIGCVGVGFDMTDMKVAEDVLRARSTELEDLNKLMIGRELKMVELKEELGRLKEGKDDATAPLDQ